MIDEKQNRNAPKPRPAPALPRVASLTPRTEAKYKDIDEKFARFKMHNNGAANATPAAEAQAAPSKPQKRLDTSNLRVHIPSASQTFGAAASRFAQQPGRTLSPGRLPISTPNLANAISRLDTANLLSMNLPGMSPGLDFLNLHSSLSPGVLRLDTPAGDLMMSSAADRHAKAQSQRLMEGQEISSRFARAIPPAEHQDDRSSADSSSEEESSAMLPQVDSQGPADVMAASMPSMPTIPSMPSMPGTHVSALAAAASAHTMQREEAAAATALHRMTGVLAADVTETTAAVAVKRTPSATDDGLTSSKRPRS